MNQLANETASVDTLSDATSRDTLERHAGDFWPMVAKWTEDELETHLPVEVAVPGSVEEVADVLGRAARDGIAVVPYGGGSGVVGSVVTARPHLSLDLAGLNRVITVDREAGLVVVQAGKNAGELERELNEIGLRIPHYPQSLDLATVGGLVATRSAGTFSSKYGNIENFVIAVKAVLADGSVVSTKTVPRSSTGPNLVQLFVGSEGTLGVIVEVTLRVLPLAEHTSFLGVAFADLGEGLQSVRRILDRGVTPAVIRLYDGIEARHLFAAVDIASDDRNLLVLAFDGAEPVVAAELGIATDVVVAAGGVLLGAAIGEAWERSRFNWSWLERGNESKTSLADAIEVSGTWPVLAALRDRVVAAVEPHVDSVYAHYSHFYSSGGSIYFIFTTTAESTERARERYLATWSAAMDTVLAAGGSISHHHGVGAARRAWLPAELGTSHTLLRRLKGAFDPSSLLSPEGLALGASELDR